MNNLALILKSLLLSLALSFAAFAASPVNINSADATALASGLHGVGPAKAQAIVDYRQANGPFKSIDQLASVKGIGLATVEKNRDRIQLDASRTSQPE
jgi:competence protein ComEA